MVNKRFTEDAVCVCRPTGLWQNSDTLLAAGEDNTNSLGERKLPGKGEKKT